MSAVKYKRVVYVGNSPAVEGAGYRFPLNEPVEVPADIADSLIRGAFELAKDEVNK